MPKEQRSGVKEKKSSQKKYVDHSKSSPSLSIQESSHDNSKSKRKKSKKEKKQSDPVSKDCEKRKKDRTATKPTQIETCSNQPTSKPCDHNTSLKNDVEIELQCRTVRKRNKKKKKIDCAGDADRRFAVPISTNNKRKKLGSKNCDQSLQKKRRLVKSQHQPKEQCRVVTAAAAVSKAPAYVAPSLTSARTRTVPLGEGKPRPFNLSLPALVLAPMVGGSELAFRMLTRNHGVTLCYTPMMYSSRFATDKTYRDAEFQTHPSDRPLVAHFCGNDPDTMLAAARLIEKDCDAIDINLGCPQRIAHSGHFGSYLLGLEDRHIVRNMVTRLVGGLDIPVFCKIRLLDTVEDTVELCRDIAAAGCSLIAIHARYRGTATRRRDGPAHLDQLTQVVKALRSSNVQIPILANGNVRCAQDVVDNLQSTDTQGIMSAEGILDDPAIFAQARDKLSPCAGNVSMEGDAHSSAVPHCDREKRKLIKKIRRLERLQAKPQGTDGTSLLTDDERRKVSRLGKYQKMLHELETSTAAHLHLGASHPSTSVSTAASSGFTKPLHGGATQNVLAANTCDGIARRVRLAREYLDLCVQYPSATHAMKIFHVRRMCREPFDQFQLLDDCCMAETHAALCAVVEQCLRYLSGVDTFVYDADKHTRAQAAAARRKLERQKRKTFEGRMTRKAKREGKPLDFYLKIGLSPPSRKDVVEFKQLHQKDAKEATSKWRQQFSQHCFAFHCLSGGLPGDGGCTRGGRACAFLHMEIMDSIADAQPTWLDEATS
eukprot:m.1556443 g.1556443  ORF g.1556443 m.1556443 type:complete len:770 (+) comp25272_c2_seq20:256-2565(+)